MKKCPFCVEEDIRDDAIKCKHCGEWFEDRKINNERISDKEPLPIKSEIIKENERILCADDSCIGILNPEGICTECGRTPAEVQKGVKGKIHSYSVVGFIPKSLFTKLKIFGSLMFISFILALVIFGALESAGIQGDIFKLIPCILMIVSNLLFMRYIGILAILLGKSPIVWVGGCLVCPVIFHIYAYDHLKGLAASKIIDS
jgi:hypothetical protein